MPGSGPYTIILPQNNYFGGFPLYDFVGHIRDTLNWNLWWFGGAHFFSFFLTFIGKQFFLAILIGKIWCEYFVII